MELLHCICSFGLDSKGLVEHQLIQPVLELVDSVSLLDKVRKIVPWSNNSVGKEVSSGIALAKSRRNNIQSSTRCSSSLGVVPLCNLLEQSGMVNIIFASHNPEHHDQVPPFLSSSQEWSFQLP